MKKPLLLIDEDMEVRDVLTPQSMQLSLKINGQSTCTMTLGKEAPEIEVGSLIQIFAPNDDNETVVMFVKSRRKDYTTGLQELSLAHAFGLLADAIAFGEATPEVMSGTTGATTVAPGTAIDYLLDCQDTEYWERTDCDFSTAEGWSFTNCDVLSALSSISESIEDCQWLFDFSRTPWGLKLKEIPENDDYIAELRKDRNIASLRINVDRSQMYTRAYPTGKNDLHIADVNSGNNFVDASTILTYGTICKVITDSTIESASLLKKWAKKQVKRNGHPKITVTINGYDLSKLTGNTLDKLVLGSKCLLTIPDELASPIIERIVELTWSDCVTDPEAVTITMANDLYTMTGILAEQISKSGGAGSKKANTQHDNELGKHKKTLGDHETEIGNQGAAIIKDIQVSGPSNNVYTLQYMKYGSSSWTNAGTFSRAITSWTMGWSNGTFTVKANPQNQSCNTQIVQGTATWDGNTATIPIDGIDSDNPNYQYYTGRSIEFSRAITSWTKGWDNGVLTITANPQSQYVRTTLYKGTESWNGTTVTIPINAMFEGDQTVYSTGKSVSATYSGSAADRIKGWNDYEGTDFIIPTDSGSGNKFKIPSRKDSNGNWSYSDWTRANTAWNNAQAISSVATMTSTPSSYSDTVTISSNTKGIEFTVGGSVKKHFKVNYI